MTVDKENKVYLNGDQKSIGELAAAVERLIKAEPNGKRTVLLKIHKDTLSATFTPIIEAVSQAGGDLVHVLSEEQPPK